MKLCHLIPLAVLVLACGGQGAQSEDDRIDYDTVGTLLTIEELPPLPMYPNPDRGKLVTATAGDYDLAGVWDVQVGSCSEIGISEIYAGRPGLRIGLLLRLPERDRLGSYPVVPTEVDFPAPPAALVAVQVYEEAEAYGFQAYTGELEISEFGERISGRFGVSLREIGMKLFTQFVGVFESISVEALAPDYCAEMRDTHFATDSAAIADSVTDETP